MNNVPGSDKSLKVLAQIKFNGDTSRKEMVFIKAGTFTMGGNNDQADPDEFPNHKVTLNSFWIDRHEVTNAQYTEFVNATGYVTTAEKPVNWEELKKQLPAGTPKPENSQLLPGSMVFTPPGDLVDVSNYTQWWSWVPGANWRHPEGPDSDLKGKENFPVVHVSWIDAMAYCKWAGKRLPSESEWEFAARGGLENQIYPWGNEPIDAGKAKANTWQGTFPGKNLGIDGFISVAPVKSFKANGYDLYDMAGNVWEWCSDWYRNDYYNQVNKADGVVNPRGPADSFDPNEPTIPKKVVRGGSYLCNDGYCSGYRVSRRMKSSWDSGMSNLGFRCVSN